MNFATLARAGNKLRLLDQTKLPLKVEYVDYDDYPGIIDAIRQLKVRGAPAIGIAGAYALAVAIAKAQRHDREFVDKVAREIKNARPTAVNLTWAVERVLDRLNGAGPQSLDKTLDILWSEAEAIHEEDRRLCERMGQHGAELIQSGDSVLTHCNAGALATGGIGTALGVIYTCHQQGKKISVFADETRPLLQGARLTAWELQQEGIDITLIADNMAGMLMKQGRIDHVIVGADRIAKNGDFANKIGTYSVAVLAEKHGVPFYVAAPYSSFDNNIASGADIPIEIRSPDEVTNGFGVRTAPEGIKVFSPAFDVTPYELVTWYITEEGLKPGGRRR
ncbi:MAG: S-methyl-5-thioribose-1-phosphate isomerase [Candidatus Zixiibacteriota bacterium]